MAKQCIHPVNTESPDDIIKSLLIRQGDIPGLNFMKFRGVVPELWRDLNLYTVKYTKRYLIPVDKNTNSIMLQDDTLLLSSVSIIDDCNLIRPISVNLNIHDDIVDLSQDKNCHCECGCKSELCGQIKTYESIVTDTEELMPDDSTQVFTSVTRKLTDEHGRLVIERTFPVRTYEDGEWVGVELKTETEELCELEVDECGCVKNTTENVCKVNKYCNATTFAVECGSTFCSPTSKDTYNVSEQGNRLVFPDEFSHDKVLVRYFAENSVKDLRIPLIAKKAFISGLMDYTLPFDETQPKWRIDMFHRKHRDDVADLFTNLNRFSFKQLNQVLNPHRSMP